MRIGKANQCFLVVVLVWVDVLDVAVVPVMPPIVPVAVVSVMVPIAPVPVVSVPVIPVPVVLVTVELVSVLIVPVAIVSVDMVVLLLVLEESVTGVVSLMFVSFLQAKPESARTATVEMTSSDFFIVFLSRGCWLLVCGTLECLPSRHRPALKLQGRDG